LSAQYVAQISQKMFIFMGIFHHWVGSEWSKDRFTPILMALQGLKHPLSLSGKYQERWHQYHLTSASDHPISALFV